MKTERLESYSIEELYALADRMGLDLPPDLERPFVIEELIEALAEENEDRRSSQGEAVHVDEKKFSGFDFDGLSGDGDADCVLEDRYNETMIHAIVRDPLWAFAFWDLSDAELEELRGGESSAGLFLRVIEISARSEGQQYKEYFDIPVSDEDRQWYINLPRSGVRFRVDLCARRPGMMGGKTRIMARSNEVQSPRQCLASPLSSLDESRRALLSLSGIEDLHIEEPVEEGGRSSGESHVEGAWPSASLGDAAVSG